MSLHQRLHRLITRAPAAPAQELHSKTIMVTGCGPDSIGFATAKLLAQRGAQLIISTRQNSAASAAEIARAAQVPAGQVQGVDLDLLDSASVRQCAAQVQALCPQLDVLINNAGIHLDLLREHKSPQRSSDGEEIHWRCNYLGTAHLTQELLPLLLASAAKTGDARVVHVASMLHQKGKNEQLFTPPAQHDSWVSYGNSKLALLHHAFELQRRYSALGLQAYALHPGAVFTQVANKGLAGHAWIGAIRQRFAWLESLFLLTPEEGAQTSVYCATAPQLLGGRYFSACRIAAHHADADDAAVAARLYAETLAHLDRL